MGRRKSSKKSSNQAANSATGFPGTDWKIWALGRLPKFLIVPVVIILTLGAMLRGVPDVSKGLILIWGQAESGMDYLKSFVWDPANERAEKSLAQQFAKFGAYVEARDLRNLEIDFIDIMNSNISKEMILKALKKPENEKVMKELMNSSNTDVRRCLHELKLS